VSISYVISVLLTLRIEKLGSRWRDFRETLYLIISPEICRENRIHLFSLSFLYSEQQNAKYLQTVLIQKLRYN
jgi:hypothetical protein